MVKHEKVTILEFYHFFPPNSYIITFLFFKLLKKKLHNWIQQFFLHL